MKRNQTRRLTLAAMMGAVSFVLMYFSFSVPVLSPFASFDLSALPDLIGGFVLGRQHQVQHVAGRVREQLVVGQLRLGDDILVPAGEVLRTGSEHARHERTS